LTVHFNKDFLPNPGSGEAKLEPCSGLSLTVLLQLNVIEL
jgi:hypothetical protein